MRRDRWLPRLSWRRNLHNGDPDTRMRSSLLVIGGILLGPAAASCGPGHIENSHLASRDSATTAPPHSTVPTTPASTPLTPVTGLPGVTPSTVIVHYPNPYDPGYSTIDQLVQDSTFIVLGTLLPATPGVDQTEIPLCITRYGLNGASTRSLPSR